MKVKYIGDSYEFEENVNVVFEDTGFEQRYISLDSGKSYYTRDRKFRIEVIKDED